MAKFIAHRGNYKGPLASAENTQDYLNHAYFDMGFDVEVDLIEHNGILYYGHDEPQAVADTNFLQRDGVWCHAKNYGALEELLVMRTNCFWHQTDDVTLTSQKYMWCYPEVYINDLRAVWVDIEGKLDPSKTFGIYAICGDYAGDYWQDK